MARAKGAGLSRKTKASARRSAARTPTSQASPSSQRPAARSAAASDKAAGRDSIAQLIGEWRNERPDLDPWPLEILGRIQRLSVHLSRIAEQRLQTIGLTWETFSLIVTLRRAGAPYALRPTDIYKKSLLTSGTVTNRIDNVVRMGLAVREPAPTDRRSVAIRLTPAGVKMADRAIAMHLEAMAETLSVLGTSERKQTAALLSILLQSFER